MSTILVTGASKGIGRALAIKLIHDGHTVWAIARDEEKLQQLSAEIDSNNYYYAVCDVGNITNMELLKEQILAKGFEPDTLILNAGVTSLVAEENRKTNYEGIVNAWTAFKPVLQKNGGTIAISGSLFALVPAPFNVSYSQSKLDALNFVRVLAAEKESQNIRFNYFVLGPVNTELGNILPWWKSLLIPSPEKTASYIAKHLGSPGLINIFPLSSKVMILLNAVLPKAAMNRLMTFLKR